MFAIGEKVTYGSEGVFFVAEYTTSPVDKNDTRTFYVLRPVYGPSGNIIVTPVDNDKVKIRAIMSRENAESFIADIPNIPVLTIEREKNRRELYRVTLALSECDGYVSIIKTVRKRREELARVRKQVSESDNDYEKKAKFCLYGELSLALGIPFEAVEEQIINSLCVY